MMSPMCARVLAQKSEEATASFASLLATPLLCLSFLCAYCSKKMPERAPTKKQLCVLSIVDQLRAWAHRRSAYAQLSPLYPSLCPYVTHVINYSRPSPAFPYWKRRKAGRGLGTRLTKYIERASFWCKSCHDSII